MDRELFELMDSIRDMDNLKEIAKEDEKISQTIIDKFSGEKHPSIAYQKSEIENFFKIKLNAIHPFALIGIMQYDSANFMEYYLNNNPKIDLNMKDRSTENQNLLANSLELDLTSVFYELESRGAKLETDEYNILPNIAAKNGNIEVLKYLINNKKLDINKVDYEGNNIIHEALHSKNFKVLDFVLNNPKLDKSLFLKPNNFLLSPKELFEVIKSKNKYSDDIIKLVEDFEKKSFKKKLKLG